MGIGSHLFYEYMHMYCCIVVLLYCCLVVLLYCCIVVLLFCSIVVLLFCSIVVLLYAGCILCADDIFFLSFPVRQLLLC